MWSYVLAVIGVTGIFFVGRKTIWGWLVLLVNEGIWIAYALATKQYGFILMATAYSAVYIRSFIHWKRDDRFTDSSQLEVLCYNCGVMYKVGYDAVRECPKCVKDEVWDKGFDWHHVRGR